MVDADQHINIIDLRLDESWVLHYNIHKSPYKFSGLNHIVVHGNTAAVCHSRCLVCFIELRDLKKSIENESKCCFKIKRQSMVKTEKDKEEVVTLLLDSKILVAATYLESEPDKETKLRRVENRLYVYKRTPIAYLKFC